MASFLENFTILRDDYGFFCQIGPCRRKLCGVSLGDGGDDDERDLVDGHLVDNVTMRSLHFHYFIGPPSHD